MSQERVSKIRVSVGEAAFEIIRIVVSLENRKVHLELVYLQPADEVGVLRIRLGVF